jgi:hypothetical protein
VLQVCLFTSDGLQVATASQPLSNPEHWSLEMEPVSLFEAIDNPRAFSIMQTYTQTEELPVIEAAQVTGPLPSYKLGPGDEMFTNLADLNFNKFVTGRALPEYATLLTSHPPALVMALTQELNHSRLEPPSLDTTQLQLVESNIQAIVRALTNLCPSLHKQFERLGLNRLQALNMTKDNKCWRCGKEGHIRANCTAQLRTPRYATDGHQP